MDKGITAFTVMEKTWDAFLSVTGLRGVGGRFVIDGPIICKKDRHHWEETQMQLPLHTFKTYKCKDCDSRMASTKKPAGIRRKRTASRVVPDGEQLCEL